MVVAVTKMLLILLSIYKSVCVCLSVSRSPTVVMAVTKQGGEFRIDFTGREIPYNSLVSLVAFYLTQPVEWMPKLLEFP